MDEGINGGKWIQEKVDEWIFHLFMQQMVNEKWKRMKLEGGLVGLFLILSTYST